MTNINFDVTLNVKGSKNYDEVEFSSIGCEMNSDEPFRGVDKEAILVAVACFFIEKYTGINAIELIEQQKEIEKLTKK